jgi:dihydroorotate dehydrogenase electron transfer subunit
MVPSQKALSHWSAVQRAADWARGFLVAFDELRARCFSTAPEQYNDLCSPVQNSQNGAGKIARFTGTVLKNIPVGGQAAPHYKLRFEAPGLNRIAPTQFIMMDTAPRERKTAGKAVPWSAFKASFLAAPQTYLKRPFGIHRVFYPRFGQDHLCRLSLPRALAAVAHTAAPQFFEIFYKVQPAGKGTREMRLLQPGTKINLLGPLGRHFDIAKMIDDGIEEVHVIGGGVGMAPLIFLVQAVRFYGITVKAFIGIESIELLKYQEASGQMDQKDQLDESFAARPKDAHIYVDDLKDAGVKPNDIYLSSDKPSDVTGVVPKENYCTGFVSQLYQRYLSTKPKRGNVMAFACGPMPMMEAVHNVARAHQIPLRVLMEKRMACGIGVCLSCVCKTTTSVSGYSRVCKEGPVFDANEIVWKTKD